MAFIRMNCYAYGGGYLLNHLQKWFLRFGWALMQNQFFQKFSSITILRNCLSFFLRFTLVCTSAAAASLSGARVAQPTHSLVSFLVWLARKSELSQQVEVKTGSSKKTRNLRTGALRPPNAFFHATFTLGQSGGNVKQTTVAIIKGSTCTRHEEGQRGTYCTRYNFNSYVVFSLTWKPLALILSRLYIHTAHH